jgi:hypothetical protein
MRRNQRAGLSCFLGLAEHDSQFIAPQFQNDQLLKTLQIDLSSQSDASFGGCVDSLGLSLVHSPIRAIATLFMVYFVYHLYHNRMWTSASPSYNAESQKSSDRNVARSNTVIRRKPQDDKGHAHFQPPDDSDEGEDDLKKQDTQLPRGINSTSSARFACPYFKRTPHLYFHSQSCRGPGWRTVNHMK